jgi:hypothetical protein
MKLHRSIWTAELNPVRATGGTTGIDSQSVERDIPSIKGIPLVLEPPRKLFCYDVIVDENILIQDSNRMT